MSAQFGPPYLPGTFWDIHGRRYVIDLACHWVRIDEAVLFRIPPMAPDTDGAVQLHLVPIDPAAAPEGCSCSCTCEGKTHHWASCEHRPAAESGGLREAVEALAELGVREQWPPDEWRAGLRAVLAAHSTEGTDQ